MIGLCVQKRFRINGNARGKYQCSVSFSGREYRQVAVLFELLLSYFLCRAAGSGSRERNTGSESGTLRMVMSESKEDGTVGSWYVCVSSLV